MPDPARGRSRRPGDSSLEEAHWDRTQDLVERRESRRGRGIDRRRPAGPPSAEPDLTLPCGTVATAAAGRCRVWLDRPAANGAEVGTACVAEEPTVECQLPRRVSEDQQTLLAVGDRVTVRERSGFLWVDRILPRRSRLVRPDPHNFRRERVIVANADLAMIVVTPYDPPLHPRVIDRFQVLCHYGGIEPLVCLNKVDLLESEEARSFVEEILAPYQAAALAIHWISARDGSGMKELRAALDGKTSVVIGHSGVGKSSLINSLLGETRQATGEISRHWERGKHTTTSSRLLSLGPETWLIDTPGVRSIGVEPIPPEWIKGFFPEFEPFARNCRFRNCNHRDEPDCEVRLAAEQEVIPSERYDGYLRLVEPDRR